MDGADTHDLKRSHPEGIGELLKLEGSSAQTKSFPCAREILRKNIIWLEYGEGRFFSKYSFFGDGITICTTGCTTAESTHL